MNIIKCIGLAAVIAATMVPPSDSHAGFIITIGDATVAPGASGYLDVLIRWDNEVGDSFQGYILDFLVNAAVAEPIKFVQSVIPAPQLMVTDPYPYIFLGNSLVEDYELSVDEPKNFGGPPLVGDLITVIDDTLDLEDRKIEDGDVFLLARLNFEVPTNATVDNKYKVLLHKSIFFPADSDATSYSASQSFDGEIRIGAAAAVPEPSSIVLMAIGSLIMSFLRWRRKSTLPCPI